jgi:hypothetical protein
MHVRGAQAQSLARHIMSGSATPEPVQLAAQPCAESGPNACSNYFAGPYFSTYTGTTPAAEVANVYAIVNPSPSPGVDATWAPPSASAPVVLPSPNPSATPGVLTIIAKGESGAVTLSGTVPIPGQPQTVTPQVYVFPTIALACQPSVEPATIAGVSFVNGAAITTSDPSTADLYIDGPKCEGNFANAGETSMTLHAPGGAALFSVNTESFADITTSQWSSAFTSQDQSTLINDLAAFEWLGEIKTRTGGYVRFFITQAPSGVGILMSYDQSGASITGSY